MRIETNQVKSLLTLAPNARKLTAPIALLCAALGCNNAMAVPVLWIDDAQNRLGTVDVGTGAISIIGSMGSDTMTDIAFDRDGGLWGVSFSRTYRINTTTGATTLVGTHGISGGNALVFGTDGTLYAAGFAASGLFTIDTATGVASLIGSSSLLSNSADLAFNQGQMFMSNTLNQLVKVDTSTPANSSFVGNIGFSNVWGIATADDGSLYGAGNTTIIKIDPTTGAGTFLRNYGGGALGQAYGTAFITEAIPAIPEPSSVALLVVGALASGLRVLHSRKVAST